MSNPAVPLRWVPLAAEADVPEGSATLATYGSREILIFHRDGGWTAYDNTCPHAGAPIEARHFDGECVTCVYHGLRFRASDGTCPEAPAWTLEPFQVKVENGRVYVGIPSL